MAKEKTTLLLRSIILLIFIISLFLSAVCYGALIFTNWMSSAKKTTEQIAADANEYIYKQVCSFMQAPYQMNELTQKIIENGMLDLSDEKQRDRFFAAVHTEQLHDATKKETLRSLLYLHNFNSHRDFYLWPKCTISKKL